MIITTSCWKCNKEMKVALAEGRNDSDGACRGPESFTAQEIKLAEANGVILKIAESKTAEELYLANICPYCGAFVGQWYFFTGYYAPALYGHLKYEVVS